MDSSNIIGRWAALLLAEVLNLSATVAEKILSGQPRWVAQLRLLEANLRPPAGGSQDAADGESEAPAADTTQQMLESYAILSRTLKDIEARGLALDGALVERMRCDWSPKSIVGYLVTCDARLKQEIGEALTAAAGAVGPASAAAGEHGEAKRKGTVS